MYASSKLHIHSKQINIFSSKRPQTLPTGLFFHGTKEKYVATTFHAQNKLYSGVSPKTVEVTHLNLQGFILGI